jgi:hypothetical protein
MSKKITNIIERCMQMIKYAKRREKKRLKREKRERKKKRGKSNGHSHQLSFSISARQGEEDTD